jgi:hypothetical protein
MPLVFVHGVATRQTPEYQARVYQRDTLFQKLVLPKGSPKPFDPDWGSNAVKFDPTLPWLPKPGSAEAWSVGDGVGGESGISRIAHAKPALAVDLAFTAGLEQRIQAAAESGQRKHKILAGRRAVRIREWCDCRRFAEPNLRFPRSDLR